MKETEDKASNSGSYFSIGPSFASAALSTVKV
jgi:hypothetical protein